MSWLTNTRSRLTAFMKRRETPENLWHKCRNCGAMLYAKEFDENLRVCTTCDHHERIGPAIRFGQLFDGGTHTRIAVPAVAEDPLHFTDQRKYTDRIKTARTATGEHEAMAVAKGQLGGVKPLSRFRISPSWAARWGRASARCS